MPTKKVKVPISASEQVLIAKTLFGGRGKIMWYRNARPFSGSPL
jgi:hypothetical protein